MFLTLKDAEWAMGRPYPAFYCALTYLKHPCRGKLCDSQAKVLKQQMFTLEFFLNAFH